MTKLGLSFEELKVHNPEIIMLSMPAFGAVGPWATYRGYGSTVEQGAGLSIGQDNTVAELIKLRDDLKKQVDEQAGSIKQLKEHMNTLNGRIVELEGEKEEGQLMIKELKEIKSLITPFLLLKMHIKIK